MKLIKLAQTDMWQRFWLLWQTKGIKEVISTTWSYFWLRFSGLGYWGRIATWLATWLAPPYKMRRTFARYYESGYIAPNASIEHSNLEFGEHVFIGDRVKITADASCGSVKLGSVKLDNGVYLHNDICIETKNGGSLQIGEDTHIQARCQFLADNALIKIGCSVQIASSCGFYQRNPDITPDEIIKATSSLEKVDIVVGDDVWIGHGVTILEGVCIGKGAVIGSGAIVNRDIPEGAITVGVPAHVIGNRSKAAKVAKQFSGKSNTYAH